MSIRKTAASLTFPRCGATVFLLLSVSGDCKLCFEYDDPAEMDFGVHIYAQLGSLCPGIVLGIQMLFLDKKNSGISSDVYTAHQLC